MKNAVITDFFINQHLSSKKIVKEDQQRQEQLMASQSEETKQALANIITGIRKVGEWDSLAGEVVVSSITSLPTWPSNRSLEINDTISVDADTVQDRTPVRLKLQGNHYSLIIEGELKQVPGDGDCFYHSILDSLTDYEKKILLNGRFVENSQKANIQNLRTLYADYLQQSPASLLPVAAAMQMAEDGSRVIS